MFQNDPKMIPNGYTFSQLVPKYLKISERVQISLMVLNGLNEHHHTHLRPFFNSLGWGR